MLFKSAFFLILLLSCPLAHASELTELANSLRQAGGTEAQFVQKFLPKGFTREQVEKGSVLFGDPPRMRWTYLAPEPKVFVFDGTTSWFYTPADRQVAVTTLTDEQKKDIPFLFLADSAAVTKLFTVRELKKGRQIVTTLTSREQGAAIPEAKITTSTNHQIRSLEYKDQQGNRTLFEFSGHRKVKPQGDAFAFKTPAGVRELKNLD